MHAGNGLTADNGKGDDGSYLPQGKDAGLDRAKYEQTEASEDRGRQRSHLSTEDIEASTLYVVTRRRLVDSGIWSDLGVWGWG